MPLLTEKFPPPEIFSLTPSVSEEAMLVSMGVGAGRPVKKRLSRYIEEALPIINAEAEPKLVWRSIPIPGLIAQFPESRRLRRYLLEMSEVVIMAGTAGNEWWERVIREKNPMKAYVFSAGATALARSTLDQARHALALRDPYRNIEDAISPGTDGLPLALQSGMSQLLPLSDIGIEMDAQSLFMTPLASVTAIIGIGPRCEEPLPVPPYDEIVVHCETCSYPACSLRVSPYQPVLDASR